MRPSVHPHYDSPSRNRVYKVSEPATLMNFLLIMLSDKSRTTVKSLLAHRQITINGSVSIKFDAPLKPGDNVAVFFDKRNTPLSHPLLTLVYEDDSIIVIDKKAGLLSMSTDRIKEKTAYHILSDYVKQSNPRNCIFILHRLDRDTSGLMMFAKNRDVQEKLQSNWDRNVLERKYMAVVEGVPAERSGTVESYIAENSAMIVHTANPINGKLAITHYRLLKTNQQFSLLELDLETGRKNQIRVHMQELRTPVTGDKKYGARYNPIHRLALHAFKLHFIHPVSGEEMKFDTLPPKNFMLLVKNRR